MADNVSAKQGCTGNCMNCTLFQRQYCASQIGYNNMGLIERLMDKVSELGRKIEAMQSNEALINPITQEGSGV